jgi:large subunit ribosomal protein L7/L12
MTTKINSIIEELKTLTLIESVELINQIENIFNINTSSAIPALLSNSTTESISQAIVNNTEIEEKSTFDILLSEVPSDKKITILKIVRNITGLGLKESKEIVDNVPRLIKENITKDEIESIKKEFEAVGAKVIVK